MPGERVSMRNIREVLRLHLGQGLPQRVIAQSLRLGLGAVNGYVGRARRAKLQWPLPDSLDDDRLEALLFSPLPEGRTAQRPSPDWGHVQREMRRAGRHHGAAVGGVPGRGAGRVRLFMVL